jgi:hypothetical protein
LLLDGFDFFDLLDVFFLAECLVDLCAVAFDVGPAAADGAASAPAAGAPPAGAPPAAGVCARVPTANIGAPSNAARATAEINTFICKLLDLDDEFVVHDSPRA